VGDGPGTDHEPPVSRRQRWIFPQVCFSSILVGGSSSFRVGVFGFAGAGVPAHKAGCCVWWWLGWPQSHDCGYRRGFHKIMVTKSCRGSLQTYDFVPMILSFSVAALASLRLLLVARASRPCAWNALVHRPEAHTTLLPTTPALHYSILSSPAAAALRRVRFSRLTCPAAAGISRPSSVGVIADNHIMLLSGRRIL
jgi:hypothetical protein